MSDLIHWSASKEKQKDLSLQGTSSSSMIIIIVFIAIVIILTFRSFKGSLGDGTTTGNIKTIGAPAQD